MSGPLSIQMPTEYAGSKRMLIPEEVEMLDLNDLNERKKKHARKSYHWGWILLNIIVILICFAFPCAMIFIYILSKDKMAAQMCLPNGRFNPAAFNDTVFGNFNTARSTFKGTASWFTPTWIIFHGPLTFNVAKGIDITSDFVFGRILQSILALIFGPFYMKTILARMTLESVPYTLFTKLAWTPESAKTAILLLQRSIGGMCCATRKGRVNRQRRQFFLMGLCIFYISALPTLTGMATGYIPFASAVIPNRDTYSENRGVLYNISDFHPTAYVVAGASRLGEGWPNSWAIAYGDNDEELKAWDDYYHRYNLSYNQDMVDRIMTSSCPVNGLYECMLHGGWSVAGVDHFPDPSLSTTIQLRNQTISVDAPPLAVFKVNTTFSRKGSENGYRNDIIWLTASRLLEDTFCAPVAAGNSSGRPTYDVEGKFRWGASWRMLILLSILFSFFVFTTYWLWRDQKRHLYGTAFKDGLNEYTAAIALSCGIHDKYGPEAMLMSKKDLKKQLGNEVAGLRISDDGQAITGESPNGGLTPTAQTAFHNHWGGAKTTIRKMMPGKQKQPPTNYRRV